MSLTVFSAISLALNPQGHGRFADLAHSWLLQVNFGKLF
jgi:hypothetical protein